MKDKICKVCGKVITATKRQKFCSDECCKKFHNARGKEYYKKYKKPIVGRICKFCGEEVKPIKAIRIIKRKFHDECLIKAAYEEIQRGGKMGTSEILKYAANKGFTKSEILEYMEELQNERE